SSRSKQSEKPVSDTQSDQLSFLSVRLEKLQPMMNSLGSSTKIGWRPLLFEAETPTTVGAYYLLSSTFGADDGRLLGLRYSYIQCL
ncbi:hypothetical protein AOLI_G00323400, partial [Acnodon oligacanthus]